MWLKGGGGGRWRGTEELCGPCTVSTTSESTELPSPWPEAGVGNRKLKLLKKGTQLPAGPCGLPEDQTRTMQA